jgi:hypothetical protein
MNNDNTELGKIIGSKSHIDYVFEVYDDKMRENPPEPTDYEFGQFVYIKKEINGQNHCFVGVIYDTQIVDPDQGRSGPRLSQPDEQEVFHPGYVDEKRVLAGIALLGCISLDEDGEVEEIEHTIPRWTLEVDDVVQKLPDEDMVNFHELDGELQLGYYQRMIDVSDEFAEEIIKKILNKLKHEKPEEAETLDVIRQNLEWQTRMEAVR